MAPTRDFKETIRDRIRRDPAVADALLEQSVECLHTGEADVARILLRDCIYAIVGLEQLSRLTGKPPDSLEHMLETDDNTEARDLLEVISLIQQNKDSQTEADKLLRSGYQSPDHTQNLWARPPDITCYPRRVWVWRG